MAQKLLLYSLTPEELIARIVDSVRIGLQSHTPETAKPVDDFIDTKTVCAILKISKPTLRKFVREGNIKAYRINQTRTLRYKRNEIVKAVTAIQSIKHSRNPS